MTLPELRAVSARVFVRALENDGFEYRRSSGSHRVFRHPDGRRAIVAFHGSGETFAPGTLVSMIRQTRWTEADLRRLGLLRD